MLDLCTQWREKLAPLLSLPSSEASDGELAAWISFAIAFPTGFMALVDTYDVRRYPRAVPAWLGLIACCL
jgi:nicotinate phosphoribosyltransferase